MNRILKIAASLGLAASLILPMAARAEPLPVARAGSCTLIELLVVIAVKDSAGRTVQTVTTDRKGNFRLSLRPGTYRLVVTGDSLTRALGPAGPGGKAPVVGVKLSLLLPAVQAIYEDQGPVVRAGARIQDFELKPVLVSGLTKAGQGVLAMQGSVYVAGGDFDGDGR